MADVETPLDNAAKPEETPKDDAPVEEVKKNGTEEPISSDEVAVTDVTKSENEIIRQIEYYFGDANLSRDKFLLEKIGQNEGGWVPLSVLLTFKRLANLSNDAKVIIAALQKSSDGLIEIDAENEKVRRHPEQPIPEQNEEKRLEVQSRTAYVKGFPPVGTEMSDLIEFFSPYEKVVHILMRKYHEKASKKYLFKGSCFVTFSKKEEAAAFIDKEKVEYKENELIRKWKETYLDEKKEERSKDDQKRQKNKNKKDEDVKEFLLPTGAVLYLEGFPKEGITREDIKARINELGATAEIAFVEFSKGDENGHIRFTEENAAKTVFEKFDDGKIKIKENEVTGRVVEGDEEKEFLAKAVENMRSRRNNSNKHRRGGNDDRHGKHGRHHGGGHRKRKHDGDDDEPSKKK